MSCAPPRPTHSFAETGPERERVSGAAVTAGSCSPCGTGCPPTACGCAPSPPTRASASSGGCSGPRRRRRCVSPWGSAAASPSPQGRSTRPSSTAAPPSRSPTRDGHGAHRGRGAGRHRPAGAEAPRVHHRNRLLTHPRARAPRRGARTPPRPLAPRRGRGRGNRVAACSIRSTGPRSSRRQPADSRRSAIPAIRSSERLFRYGLRKGYLLHLTSGWSIEAMCNTAHCTLTHSTPAGVLSGKSVCMGFSREIKLYSTAGILSATESAKEKTRISDKNRICLKH